MDIALFASRAEASSPTHGRRAAWITLLLGLALSQVLGGGCSFAYSSGNHDHDDDDDNNSVVIINSTGEAAGGPLVAADSPFATDPLDHPERAATGSIFVVLQEMPDADGDGLADLAILAVDAGDAELPASTWLLSGADASVLDTRDLGALRPRARLAPTPAATTASPVVRPSDPTTSGQSARDPAPAGAHVPHRD